MKWETSARGALSFGSSWGRATERRVVGIAEMGVRLSSCKWRTASTPCARPCSRPARRRLRQAFVGRLDCAPTGGNPRPALPRRRTTKTGNCTTNHARSRFTPVGSAATPGRRHGPVLRSSERGGRGQSGRSAGERRALLRQGEARRHGRGRFGVDEVKSCTATARTATTRIAARRVALGSCSDNTDTDTDTATDIDHRKVVIRFGDVTVPRRTRSSSTPNPVSRRLVHGAVWCGPGPFRTVGRV